MRQHDIDTNFLFLQVVNDRAGQVMNLVVIEKCLFKQVCIRNNCFIMNIVIINGRSLIALITVHIFQWVHCLLNEQVATSTIFLGIFLNVILFFLLREVWVSIYLSSFYAKIAVWFFGLRYQLRYFKEPHQFSQAGFSNCAFRRYLV